MVKTRAAQDIHPIYAGAGAMYMRVSGASTDT